MVDMYLCEFGHQTVCYQGDVCPVCDKIDIIDNLEKHIDNLESEINDLQLNEDL